MDIHTREVKFEPTIDKAIKLLQISDQDFPENFKLSGSQLYQEHLYPSDIDMREHIYGCCNIDEVLNEFYNELRENILKIVKEYPNVLFGDFKAGEINETPIRWSPYEILKGFKEDLQISIIDALKQPAIVKLDIYIWNGIRYLEASNFMILVLKERGKPNVFINGEQPDYVETLIKDISLYTNKGNLFKAIKRLWSVGKALKNNNIVSKINPILSSKWALLYQVKSDIQTYNTIMEKYGTLESSIYYTLKYAVKFLFNEFEDNMERFKYYILEKLSYFVNEPIYQIEDTSLSQLEEIVNNILNNAVENFLEKENIKYQKFF